MRKINFIIIICFLFVYSLVCNADPILTWDESTGDVSGYTIYYGTSKGSYPMSQYVGDVTQYPLNNFSLSEGFTYYFVVRSYNSFGESDNSNEFEYTVPESDDTTPPLPPHSVAAEIKSNNIFLTWQVSSETDLSEYRVYYGTSSRQYGLPITESGTSYTFLGLEPGILYYFAVTAVDISGNESGSSEEIDILIPTSSSDDLEINITIPIDYEVDLFQRPLVNKISYIDRAYYFIDSPDKYIGLPFIRTENGDRGNVSDVFLTFNVNKSVRLYICYSASATSYPDWLTDDFTKTDDQIIRLYHTWDVWESNNVFAAGDITLGGNFGYGSMYVVLIEEQVDTVDSVLPEITITSPTADTSYNTETVSLDIGGTASDATGVTQVTWSNSAGGNGIVSGTDNWSVTGINLTEGENIITVTAIDAAGNESTDVLTVTYAIPDTTDPSIVISSPTSDPSYNTEVGNITLNGTASDNKEVTHVTWTNSAGGNGIASGTDNWSIAGIGLAEGENVIAITARDEANNESTDVLTVTYTKPDTIVPLEVNINIPVKYEVDTLQAPIDNKMTYIDRQYRFIDSPDKYIGLTFIRTKNADRRNTSDVFLTFNVNKSVRLYVCYTDYATSYPGWLTDNFNRTDDQITRTYHTWDVWESKNVFAAGDITLGGNFGYGSMYIVLIEEEPE